jgi:hypothetical protein
MAIQRRHFRIPVSRRGLTHAEPPRFGGRMTHLLPEHQQQLAMCIQRLITSSMVGL